MSIYKECEVCKTKINKLQNASNVFLLGFGKELVCKKCKAKYKANSLFIFLYSIFNGILILFILWNYFMDLLEFFHLNTNLKIIFSIVFYLFYKIILVYFIYLNKIKD
ncbi:hypothetical protein C3I37_08750 [Campylobacter jejuni]|nr:hypothetical protein [Campylobacter jejuni]PCH20358.1 hypothetical protein BGS40_05600 [Campylobacter sp. 107]RTH80616.1 hypothetical protein C3I37_08750 [Campylobacter jejuni]